MRGGLRPLVHPGTFAHQIDIEGTRAERQRLRDELQQRQALFDRLREGLVPTVDDTKEPDPSVVVIPVTFA
ncbi:MAG: hypothetical protein AB1673_07995 [Actinomycetota bacterium]